MMMHHAHPSSPATEARLSFTSAVKNPVSVHTAGNFLASADRGFVTIFSLSAGTSRDILMACDGVHISAFSVLSVSTKSEIDGEHVMLNQSQGPQVPNSEIICHQLFFQLYHLGTDLPETLSASTTYVCEGFSSAARKFGNDVLIGSRDRERPLAIGSTGYIRPAILFCFDAQTAALKWQNSEELRQGELRYDLPRSPRQRRLTSWSARSKSSRRSASTSRCAAFWTAASV